MRSGYRTTLTYNLLWPSRLSFANRAEASPAAASDNPASSGVIGTSSVTRAEWSPAGRSRLRR